MEPFDQIVSLIGEKPHLWISLVGGGGKTTIMQQLAQVYRSLGKSVLMTTTTKIQSPETYDWKADYIFTNSESVLSFNIQKPCSVVYAEPVSGVPKLRAPESEVLEELSKRFDVVLCEADGSRHLPLKIHTDRDPVVVSANDFTICVLGMWALGKEVKDYCFGWENEVMDFKKADEKFLEWYLDTKQGLLKNTEAKKRVVVATGCNLQYEKILKKICFERKIPVLFSKDQVVY